MYLLTYEFVPHGTWFCTGTNTDNVGNVQFVHIPKTGPVRPSFRASEMFPEPVVPRSGRPSDGIPEASVHVLGRMALYPSEILSMNTIPIVVNMVDNDIH